MSHWHNCDVCTEAYECEIDDCDLEGEDCICEDCENDENDGITSDYLPVEDDNDI